MEGRFVAYCRVSTTGQGASGLGIDAQRKAITDYLNGGNWELVREFVEVESGKRSDNRPMLHQALDTCKRTGSRLLIAKLDRLSRNVAFIANLMESGVEFVAVDFPNANRLTIHILAAMAEYERSMISKRTKAALQAAKERGVKLGSPKGISKDVALKGAARSLEERQKKADEHARRVYPVIKELQDQGLSLRGIAKKLSEGKELTSRGMTNWKAMTVKYVIERANETKR
jgi:DNA invertase Pin-like site-specific DNA recombinase